MQRQQQLSEWLQSLFPNEQFELAPASADASFRRYFRVTFLDHVGNDERVNRREQPDMQGVAQRATTHTLTAGEARASTQHGRSGAQQAGTLIVMDAPTEHEDCRPFLHVAGLFEAAGVHVPHVYAHDLERGFLLLSDLGSTTYLQALTATNARGLYDAAIDALVRIQLASRVGELPSYDEALLLREMRLFPDWYIAKHLMITLSDEQNISLNAILAHIVTNNLAQPRAYVHRDYHSRNLMLSDPNPGILDFQDAVYGPITYDLVSLFKDAYICWKEAEVIDWLIRYWEKARKAGLPVHGDFGTFYSDYEWMGVQRHLKVLGVFARLYHRDGKESYLKEMPRVMNYLRCACERYIDLKPLLKLLDELLPHDLQAGYTF
jgi:aminoglycoside/choline kinase family phosphotransferase